MAIHGAGMDCAAGRGECMDGAGGKAAGRVIDDGLVSEQAGKRSLYGHLAGRPRTPSDVQGGGAVHISARRAYSCCVKPT